MDLLKDLASTKINAVLEGGKFDLSADISKLRDTPLVNVALAVDTLDLDKLAPPRRARQGAKRTNPSPQPAPAGRRRHINLSALVGPSVNGTLKIGKLVVRGLKADDVAATAKLDKNWTYPA